MVGTTTKVVVGIKIDGGDNCLRLAMKEARALQIEILLGRVPPEPDELVGEEPNHLQHHLPKQKKKTLPRIEVVNRYRLVVEVVAALRLG